LSLPDTRRPVARSVRDAVAYEVPLLAALGPRLAA